MFLSSALLTFTAGTFDVINATTGGATISSVDPIAQVTDITSGYILNPTGLVFNNATTQGITSINGSTGLFTTSSANIGNWLVSSSAISKTSVAGTVYLNSGTTNASITAVSSTGLIATFTTSAPHGFITNQYITISGFGTSTVTYNNAIAQQLTVLSSTTFSVANTGTGTPTSYGIATVSDVPSIYTVNSGGTYSAGLAGANNSTDKVFWAGASKTSPNFYVQADGTLFANSATISGNVTANSVVAGIGISSPIISSGKTSFTDTTNAGYYLGGSGTGTYGLIVGSSTSYLQYAGGSLNVVGGTITGGTIQTSNTASQKVQIIGSNNAIQFTNGSGAVVTNISPLLFSGTTYGTIINDGTTPDTSFSNTKANLYVIQGEVRINSGTTDGNGSYITVNSLGASINGGTSGRVALGGLAIAPSTPSSILMQGSLGSVYSATLTVQAVASGTPSVTGTHPGDIWLQY